MKFWRRTAAEIGPLAAVYAWPTAKGYYAETVVPRLVTIRARPSDSAAAVLARLPEGVRGFLFHIDMTDSSRFPADRDRLVEQLRGKSMRVLNAQVTDISKRRVHAVAQQLGLPCTLASREGEGRELLIVKTDRNFGGRSERLLSRRDRRRLGLTDGFASIRDTFDYRLLPRSEVPQAWWDDPRLVMERFVNVLDNRLHRAHIVLDNFAFWSGVCARPIKKPAYSWDNREHFLRRGQMSPALPEGLLRTAYQFAEAFSLDYGGIDLIADEERRFYVIDANSTPWRGTESTERFEFLRAGWENESRIPS